MANVPGFLAEHKIPVGTVSDTEIAKEINDAVEASSAIKNIVQSLQNYQVYLNFTEIEKQEKDRAAIINTIIKTLQQKPSVINVFEINKLMQAVIPEPQKEMMANGYNPKRSGDIQFTFKPGYFDGCFNNQLNLIDTFRNSGTAVDIEIHGQDFTVCNIGIMNPNNRKDGNVFRISLAENDRMKVDSNVKFIKLARPVQVTSSDLNADGKMDYLVCEYGNLTGALSWMENLGNNKFERHVLRGLPGAIKAYVRDVNHKVCRIFGCCLHKEKKV